jgi:hypothetical protein
MKEILHYSVDLRLLAFAAVLATVGCQNNQYRTAVSADKHDAQDQVSDPAAANLAPASYTTAPASRSGLPERRGAAGPHGQAPDDSPYQGKPAYTASEPPPPLPEYVQPPVPGEGYIWTPGYWAWTKAGFYWVPGAWVEPPYEDALWTPGYWVFSSGHYRFYPGHWGLHIGYYGGINYGFGYSGLGYEGGYWQGGHFNYNRVYNNVDQAIEQHLYSYDAGDSAAKVSLPSFNGGTDGVQIRPRPAEVAAGREPYAPRMNTQLDHELSYCFNQSQFASAKGIQPANLFINFPIEADRNVRPTLPSSSQVQQRQTSRPAQVNRRTLLSVAADSAPMGVR